MSIRHLTVDAPSTLASLTNLRQLRLRASSINSIPPNLPPNNLPQFIVDLELDSMVDLQQVEGRATCEPQLL